MEENLIFPTVYERDIELQDFVEKLILLKKNELNVVAND